MTGVQTCALPIFNICVAPSSVKLGVLEFTEVGVGLELERLRLNRGLKSRLNSHVEKCSNE